MILTDDDLIIALPLPFQPWFFFIKAAPGKKSMLFSLSVLVL
jgi:hypothetical protein